MKKRMAELFSSVFHKKTISLISIFLLSLFFIPFINSLTPISNCAELQNIKDDIFSSHHLINDIDCSDTINWNEGMGFIPIADYGQAIECSGSPCEYRGTFDGKNYTISNLYINRTNANASFGWFSGLFGQIHPDGIIKDLILENITLVGKDNRIGGLVGNLQGTIINARIISGSVTPSISNGFGVGGLVGIAESSSSIKNSFVNVNVNGISGTYRIGGLVGMTYTIIDNSYAIGNVIGSDEVGGLIGALSVGTITNSYAIGNVIGNNDVGGLIGRLYSGSIVNSYYNTNTSGQSDTGKGIPKTTIEMMDINTFSVWDIALIENYSNEIWFINNTYDYPRLFFELELEPECEINADCNEGYICTEGFCVLDYPVLNDVFVNKSWEGTENNTLIYYSEIYGSIVYGYNAFSTISEGVNAVNNFGYVWVRAGTYTEAIYINKDISLIGDNKDTTFILAPDIIPSRSYTSYRPMIAINTSEVLITGFTIDGLKKENTINSIVGVHFWKSSGELGWNKITGIRDEPFGSGNGIAILINHEWDTTYCHSVDIFQNIIEDYQKSGIVINEPCANAYVYNNIITGYGETEVIAQNGIQIGYGLGIASTTIIENNSISKHSYTGTGFVGTGILIVGVNNVTIKNNNIFDNENGIDLAQDLYYGSGSSLNIGILKNILTNNCKAIKIRPESNTSYIINNSISQDVSETCFMIDNWNETIAQENYFGEEYPNWETIFSNYTLVDYNPYYSEPEMDYLSYECETDEDCEEGEFCNLNGICELTATPKSTILTNVGMAMLVVLFSIGIIKFVVGKFKK